MLKKMGGVVSWLVSGLIFFVGIITFPTSIMAGLVFLFGAILISPPIVRRIQVKFDKPFGAKQKTFVILITLILGFALLVPGIEKQNIKEADSYVEEAIVFLNQNNEEEAITLIDKAKSKYSETPNKATELEAEINKFKDISKVKTELINMTDNEFDLLSQGKLEKQYFQVSCLNDRFIEMLKRDSSNRAKYIAEKKEKEEQERIAAEEKAEQERIAAEEKAEKERIAAEQAARKELIEKQFSAWDGAHYNLTRFIKENMNNPKSFEHVETVYWDMGDYLVIKTTFRGTNSFGGVVVNYVKAKVDLNGNILEIME